MSNRTTSETALKRLGFVLGLTRFGLLAETLTRAFWPVWTILFVCAAAVMMGVLDVLPLEVSWGVGIVSILASAFFVFRGATKLRWPSREDAIARLDATLPGRPIQALRDAPAIGEGDAGSQALWQAHQDRMAQRTNGARAVAPDLRLSRLDPFGLRYTATLLLLIGLLFGSVARVGDIGEIATGNAGSALAAGPTWEGWIEPPSYTGKPALYLNDQPAGDLRIPIGSRIMLRLYGEVGALTVAETVSGRTGELPSAAEPEQTFAANQDGILEIAGPGGAKWSVQMLRDMPPEVVISGQVDTSVRGEMTLPFEAADDYAITGGTAVVALDLAQVERRYGLALPPEARDPLVVPLPLPISGDRAAFEEILIEDFSDHVWAHLPVTVMLTAEDAAGQTGESIALPIVLPARRFFDPLAAAVIEMRRDLLWSKDNAPRVAQLMRAISHNPVDGIFKRETDYLRLRTILRRLEAFRAYGLTNETRDELAAALWELALNLEDGTLGDAYERLQQAQERLAEAMKNGASDSEIERLMQELRDATQDYMRELARRNQQDGEQSGEQQQQAENGIQMDQDDLQRMMDRIQELMEQGRMAEAQQALEELQQMLENMQVTQGQGQNGEGDQTMEGLADTLREQQGLSDEAFRELQEQFNPNAQAGQSGENQGFNGGEGAGQAHDGTGGEGEGEGQGEGQADGSQSGQEPGESDDMGLGDRQQALRQELNRQMQNLPGAGTPEGDAARESLGRADEAMEGAEEALRQDDLAGAIDRQAEAMDALRDGMRSLGEAMQQAQQQGSQGNAQSQGANRDPLGRSQGNRGAAGTDDGLLQGEDVYRQARRLLDEIRRRAGETGRPEVERNYLERLLDRF